ncbi:hypothetical protein MLD38_006494 [Melastoma candidum]|uniref:Uncharacterized protein n=1 Tax=Melastoma candidum TaxID=119954 RepID=A0ACB9RWI5_9MYRT|nr:hypothetical protein MLD38_006494 [Melastoma candidum]
MGKLSQESSEWIGLRWLGQFYHDYSRSVRNHCNWRKPVRVQIVPGAAASRERLGLRQGEDDRCEEDGREPGKKTGASRFRLISLQGKSLSSLLFFTEGFHSPSSFLLGIEVYKYVRAPVLDGGQFVSHINRTQQRRLVSYFWGIDQHYHQFLQSSVIYIVPPNSCSWCICECSVIVVAFAPAVAAVPDCGLAIARNLAYEAFVAAPAAGVCR